jgi:hypothetical protein
MEKRYTDDLENRDQMIASLRKKIAEKDQEINVNYLYNFEIFICINRNYVTMILIKKH